MISAFNCNLRSLGRSKTDVLILVASFSLLWLALYELMTRVGQPGSPSARTEQPAVSDQLTNGLQVLLDQTQDIIAPRDDAANTRPMTVDGSEVLTSLCSRLTGELKQDVENEFHNITSRKVVNPHHFGFTHNAPEACKGKSVTLLIAVTCRPQSFRARQAVRETWGQWVSDRDYGVVLLFFLGSTPKVRLQTLIDEEAERHGDIVQETFLDTYRNLSLKSVAVMRWASVYCPDSTFLLKADDDVYVNVPRLLKNVHRPHRNGKQFFIAGFLSGYALVRRGRWSKWKVLPEEYAEDVYPTYISGPAYMMTTVTAMRLYVESVYTKLFPMEDVYLTGLCAQQASIERLGDADFPLKWDASLLSRPCELIKHVADHAVSPGEMRQIHSLLSRAGHEEQCDGVSWRYMAFLI